MTCTPAQYIEIEADFEFYKAAWEEELAIFYSAFISKNDIFPPPELASPSDDDEIDLVRLEKVRAMMSGIDRRTRSKALPGSMNDELIAKTPIGEIVVGIKSDHDYPGIFVELRGEHLNDRFKEGAVRLAWVEYSSDKQCLQTIAYGDGNADDFTHLIEHEHILKTIE